jgi:hypothetical protein
MPRSAIKAGFLSLVLPGAGQWYKYQKTRAVLFALLYLSSLYYLFEIDETSYWLAAGLMSLVYLYALSDAVMGRYVDRDQTSR